MWIIRWIVLALFVIVIIGFAMQNTEQQVSVAFLKWQTINLPLWVVMYVSFAAGVLFWLIVSIFQIITLKTRNRKAQKEIARLKEELNRLRNVSVEEAVLPPTQEQKPVPAKNSEADEE